jgi:DNA-binding cell septation regulator SpoVG
MTKSRKRAKISETCFYPIKPTDKGVVAFVSFTYANLFRINDCAIVTKRSGGYRIVYPIKTLPNGKSISCIYPINQTIGNEIQDFLLSKYEEFLNIKTKE